MSQPSSTISTSFIDSFVWKTESGAEPASSAWSFDGDMLSDIQRAISYAFLVANDPNTVVAKTVTLLSPYHGGNAVIDAVLRIIAQKENTDVLVLDSLELAAGRFGALGKDGALVDAIYNRLPIEQFTDVEDIQQFFLDLLSAGLESTSSSDSPRRIIYMRDFGSIARAAIPLMIFIFRAIENLQSTRKANLIVLFGSSRPLGKEASPGHNDSARGFNTFKWTFEESGICSDDRKALKTSDNPSHIVPTLGSKVYYLPSYCGKNFNRRSLASACFTPVFYTSRYMETDTLIVVRDPVKAEDKGTPDKDGATQQSSGEVSDKKDHPMWWRNQLNSLLLSDLCFIVYPEDIDLANQQSILDDRASQLSGVILKLTLAQKGIEVEGSCVINGNLLKHEKQDNEIIYSIIEPATSDCILDTLLVLIGRPQSIATGDQVVEALHLWLKRRERLNKWIDRENKRVAQIVSCKKSKEASDDGEKRGPDPKSLVNKVRNSDDLSKHESKLLSCIVNTDPLSTSFQDVVINKKIIQNLRSIVSLPLLHPHHYRSGILSRETLSGALLYGPPGTGKTMVCRALACESGANMLFIKPSDVFNMWVGESEKYANAIFKLANRLAPCVVFIDEVDAIFNARTSGGGGGRDVHRAMLTEFMQAMDGLNSGTNSKDKGVVVVGATNRPFDLDQAILRRLPYRMLIDLPELVEREDILKSHLKGENLVDIDFADIASDTEGFSGSDLKNLCVSAAMEALKDCIGGLELPNDKETPQAPMDVCDDAPILVETSVADSPQRVVMMEHIKRAFKQVAASFSFEGNRELYAWHATDGTITEGLNDHWKMKVSGSRRKQFE